MQIKVGVRDQVLLVHPHKLSGGWSPRGDELSHGMGAFQTLGAQFGVPVGPAAETEAVGIVGVERATGIERTDNWV